MTLHRVAVATENFKAFVMNTDKEQLQGSYFLKLGRGLVASIQIEVTKDHPHLIFGKDIARRNPKSSSKSELVPLGPRKMESLP